MEVGNITKVATFKSLLKTHNYVFCDNQCFLIFFMRKTLTDDFGELHKDMNCVFSLRLGFCFPMK